MTTTVANVKKKHLIDYENLEEWMEDSDNLYVGRNGRIFIGSGENKKIFHYRASKWKNPFIVGKHGTQEEVATKYKTSLLSGELKDSNGTPLIEQLSELKDKCLGCWCHPNDCHAHILAILANHN